MNNDKFKRNPRSFYIQYCDTLARESDLGYCVHQDIYPVAQLKIGQSGKTDHHKLKLDSRLWKMAQLTLITESSSHFVTLLPDFDHWKSKMWWGATRISFTFANLDCTWQVIITSLYDALAIWFVDSHLSLWLISLSSRLYVLILQCISNGVDHTLNYAGRFYASSNIDLCVVSSLIYTLNWTVWMIFLLYKESILGTCYTPKYTSNWPKKTFWKFDRMSCFVSASWIWNQTAL